MSLFNRTYTFTDGTTAYGSQVETEIANIVLVLNNLNTATTNWGIVSALNDTNVPLIADCSGGSQHIADFKNATVIKASILSDGTISTVKTTNQIVLGTTNTVTLTSPAPVASRTYTIPDQGAASKFLMSAVALVDNAQVNAAGYLIGSVVQTVQVTDTSGTASSGTAYTSTPTAASITPKATTHKIRISVTGRLYSGPLSSNNYVSVFRGSTDLSNGNGFVGSANDTTTGNLEMPASMTYLDSPATTSSTTYTVKLKSSTAGTAAWNNSAGTAVILLEEIAI